MTRGQWLLIGVVAAQLTLGAYLLAQRLGRRVPPVPDLTAVDPLTAAELRDLAARCRRPADWATLGEVYLATGFFPEGEACLREAMALEPSSADFAFKHAFALERIGAVEAAITAYENAVELNHPRRTDCWYYIGKNHLRMERVAAAANAFLRAADLPAARYELALLDARADRLAQAEAVAVELSNEFPAAYPPLSLRYRLALARRDRAAADRLADLFDRAPRPLPTPFDAEVDWIFGIANGVGQNRLFGEAGKEMQAGRFANAESKLRAALQAGWNPEIADRHAEALFLLGRPKEAIEVLADAVARARPSFELLWRLGQAYDAIGRPAHALQAWERAASVATGPRAMGLWEDLADRYQRLGEKAKAAAMHGRAHWAAGAEALNAGRPADAARAFAQALEHDPELAKAWFGLGEAKRLAGHPAEARSAYQRCLELHPRHGRARHAFSFPK